MKNSAADRIIPWLTRNRLSLSCICLFSLLDFGGQEVGSASSPGGGGGVERLSRAAAEREREREKKSETGQAAGDKKKKKTKDFYHCFFLYNKK